MSKVRRNAGFLIALVIVIAAAACGGDDAGGGGAAGASDQQEEVTLTVYSGREEEFVGPLLEQFQSDEGITLEVRYGDSAELAAQLLEEGESSPADVFLSQDAGSLGAVAEAGLFTELDASILERVDERFQSPEGLWVEPQGAPGWPPTTPRR